MVYLHLYNVRKTPKEVLEDWGTFGPVLGPYDSIQVTYGFHVKMYIDARPFDGQCHQDSLVVGQNDLIFYDGMYYGDLSVFDKLAPETTIEKYSEAKTKDPLSDDNIPWYEKCRLAGDDMDCPECCSSDTIETHEYDTECSECGWSADNPVARENDEVSDARNHHANS